MTTYSNDTPYGRKHQTELHLIYKIENKQLQALGLYETRESAENELALINRNGAWKIDDIACIGWGIVDGVVGRNCGRVEPLTAPPAPLLAPKRFGT